MTGLAALLAVRCQGLLRRLTGGDATGLTYPCAGGCGSSDPHDAHPAAGALAYLGRRWR